MIPVLTRKEVFEIDKETIDLGLQTEKDLMDIAGRSIAKFVLENIKNPFKQKILVIVGKGKNGGDGVITHAYLSLFGCDSILLVLDEKILDSWIFIKYSIDQGSILGLDASFNIKDYNLIIDGIFGIGLSRDICGKYFDVIKKINSHPSIISIDIPSGIYCDSGNQAEISVIAMVTLTFGFPKLGHLLNFGIFKTGILEILDIGFENLNKSVFNLVQEKDVSKRLILPQKNVNKYTRGKLLIIGGSDEYCGALSLTCHAAFKSGVGYVRALVPESIMNYVNLTVPEAVVMPYANNILLKESLKWADAIVIGPGLKIKQEKMKQFILSFKGLKQTIILDAGGFEFFNNNYTIEDFPADTILTPHKGEMKKIFPGISLNTNVGVDKFCDDLNEKIKGRKCLLKGQPNILFIDKSEIYIMNHGEPILATAGTGDVLSGILGSLAAQKYSIVDTMIIGSWVHAEAGNQYISHLGDCGMTASDLINYIPIAMQRLRDGK